MERNHPRHCVGTTLIVVVAGALLAAALTAGGPSAQAGLPPRPSPQAPAEVPSGVAPAGATISLCVQFPQAWPWDEVAWQDLWTIVQWRDRQGAWHDVDGWRGGLDRVSAGADGAVTGHKDWWVGKDDLAKGPFRWQVARSTNGEVLGVGEEFNLPEGVGQTIRVEVMPDLP